MQIHASAFSINQQLRPSTLALRNSNFEQSFRFRQRLRTAKLSYSFTSFIARLIRSQSPQLDTLKLTVNVTVNVKKSSLNVH